MLWATGFVAGRLGSVFGAFCAWLGVIAPTTSARHNAAQEAPRSLLITIVTYAELVPIARMRPSAGTCHHYLIADTGRGVCAGGRHSPKEWSYYLGRPGPGERHSRRVRHRRQLLRDSKIEGRTDRKRRRPPGRLI